MLYNSNSNKNAYKISYFTKEEKLHIYHRTVMIIENIAIAH